MRRGIRASVLVMQRGGCVDGVLKVVASLETRILLLVFFFINSVFFIIINIANGRKL